MQPINIADILSHVLSIIGYTEDKGRFIQSFSQACIQNAFADVLEILPVEKQREVAEAMMNKKQEEMTTLLQKYISKEAYAKIWQKTIESSLNGYLTTIMPALPEEKQKELQAYLASLGTPTQQTQ